jgi:hypothetical protein
MLVIAVLVPLIGFALAIACPWAARLLSRR